MNIEVIKETLNVFTNHVRISVSDRRSTYFGSFLIAFGFALFFIPKEWIQYDIPLYVIGIIELAGLVFIGLVKFTGDETTTTETTTTKTNVVTEKAGSTTTSKETSDTQQSSETEE